MTEKKLLFSWLLIVAIGFSSCAKSTSNDSPVSGQTNQPVLFWNEVAYNAFGGPLYQHSLMASRINAIVHLAIHDALNGIEEKYTRYAFTGKNSKADPVAALASAAHTVLLNEIPDRKGFLDSALAQSLSGVKDGVAKTEGISFGKQAAQAVLAKRANDGSIGETVVPVAPSDIAGVYQAVAPFTFKFAPHWENVKPFSLERKDQFRSAPLPALTSQTYTASFNEVKDFGKLNSTVRSADQTAYSKFWYEFSEAGWNRVARVVVMNKKLNLLDAARLFALVDMAIADAYIAGWDSKLHYNFWRPFTAIRRADIDANNGTAPDPNWEASEVTPPIQDYPSTHSALGNAAAAVLAAILGDQTAFTMSSPTGLPVGSTRSFTSFTQAANENADSRVMAGIHFRFSCVAGQQMGTSIGNWTVSKHLRPIK